MTRYSDRIEQLENEVKELEEEKEFTNDQCRLAIIDDAIYNTVDSIKKLRKYV